MVEALDEAKVRNLLVTIAESDPSNFAFKALSKACSEQLAKERSRVMNFDHFSKEAWYTFNKSYYTKLSGSKQYDVAGDVCDSIIGCVESIGSQTSNVSSYGTKLSALETLRKIAKTVLLSSDCLGHEVQKEFEWRSDLRETMERIVESMSSDEPKSAAENVSEVGKGSLVDKIRWVSGQAERNCVDGLLLGNVFDLLRCEDEDDDGEDDGEEDEDDDDGDGDEEGE